MQNMSKPANTSEKSVDELDRMLWQAYQSDGVPEAVNTRLKNQLACKQVMANNSPSFWWLPAAISTVVSAAFGVILCLIYVLVNIWGADSWMPNLLQFISGAWLKIHVAALILEVMVSWIVTIVSMWKGNLVRSAKIL